MKSKKITVLRARTISDILRVDVSNGNSRAERVELIRRNLEQRKAARPKTVKTLGSTIAALFKKQISDKEVSDLIGELATRDYITVSGPKVTYK